MKGDDWKFSMSKGFWHRKDLSVAQKGVFALLCSYADSDGKCYPSKTTIGTALLISEKTVNTHLKALKKKGLVVWTNLRGSDGRKHNRYTVLGLWVSEVRKVRAIGQKLPLGHGSKNNPSRVTQGKRVKRLNGSLNGTVQSFDDLGAVS